MMKLNLNPKEAIELLIHLEQNSNPETLVDGIRQRLRSYIVSLLSSGDYQNWAKQTQKTIEVLQEQNTNLMLSPEEVDDNDDSDRKYPKRQRRQRSKK